LLLRQHLIIDSATSRHKAERLKRQVKTVIKKRYII